MLALMDSSLWPSKFSVAEETGQLPHTTLKTTNAICVCVWHSKDPARSSKAEQSRCQGSGLRRRVGNAKIEIIFN